MKKLKNTFFLLGFIFLFQGCSTNIEDQHSTRPFIVNPDETTDISAFNTVTYFVDAKSVTNDQLRVFKYFGDSIGSRNGAVFISKNQRNQKILGFKTGHIKSMDFISQSSCNLGHKILPQIIIEFRKHSKCFYFKIRGNGDVDKALGFSKRNIGRY